MINKLESYTWEGDKYGTALRNRCHSSADFHYDHVQRMINLESTEDKIIARKAFDDAAKAANPPRKPEYFR